MRCSSRFIQTDDIMLPLRQTLNIWFELKLLWSFHKLYVVVVLFVYIYYRYTIPVVTLWLLINVEQWNIVHPDFLKLAEFYRKIYASISSSRGSSQQLKKYFIILHLLSIFMSLVVSVTGQKHQFCVLICQFKISQPMLQFMWWV